MNPAAQPGPVEQTVRSERFHRWRSRKDLLARRVIGLGGLMVIAAVLLMLFYLLFVVSPLFLPASLSQTEIGSNSDWDKKTTVFLSLEE